MIRRDDLPALLTGMTATLAGIGVARFAYTALLPELVQQNWFPENQAAYLGAANLLGYLMGALSAHRLSEWIPPRALMGACSAKAIAVGLPLLSIAVVSRTLSSFVVGAMVPAIVSLTSGRIAELVGPAEHKRYWGIATAVFAVTQAFSGYSMSALYEAWGSYYLLFYTASAVLACGAVLIVFSEFLSKTETDLPT